MSRRLYQSWHYLWLCVEVLNLVVAVKFSPVTQDVGLRNESGQIAAFADFNADKTTDIFVLNFNSTTEISTPSVYTWSSKQGKFLINKLRSFPLRVAAVSAADFDGDGAVDILVLIKHGECYSASVHWSHIEKNNITITSIENSTDIPMNFTNQPLVLDVDGDHLPDLFGLTCDSNTFSFFINPGNRSPFSERPLGVAPPPLGHGPNSSYLVDLDSDCRAEIVLFYDINRNRTLEVIRRDSKSIWRQLPRVSLPTRLQKAQVVSKPSFADMDGDGVLDMVVFSCNDSSCTLREAHTLYQPKIPHDILTCQYGGDNWTLNLDEFVTVNLTGSSHSPPPGTMMAHQRPVIGDLDLDGFPDVITPFGGSLSNYTLRPLLLLGSGRRRGLRPQWDLFREYNYNVSQAAFFDLWEDGVLDVLLVQSGSASAGEPGMLDAYRQSLGEDHTFLKVLVLSGYCFSKCKSGIKPYGSVLPGAVVAFSTTDRNGNKERSTAIVQSPGSSLNLPFILFGLGETPNFIEDLLVGAVYGSNNTTVEVGYHGWSLLVPNSQVIVVTSPHNQPNKWYLELYLTPSHLVYNTAGVLCALSIGIAVIIILLQAREKYQDSKERKQAKHRFHFNAM